MVELVEQFLKFGSDGIEKNFHSLVKGIDVNVVDIAIILISDEFAYGWNKETYAKCFIGYKTDEKN